jgi:uncharacterized repeat protein (TIGR04052 family)
LPHTAERSRSYLYGMSTRTSRLLGLSLLAPLSLLSACDDAPSSETVSLAFAASVGDQPFVCGQTFTGLGSGSDQSLTIRDARLYVHNVRLVNNRGAEVALELDEDAFQHDGLAYIDFADSSIEGCEGNPETRLVINGTAPAGNYVGVRFTVGVPFEANHADASVAASPLNVTDMFWAWQSGYKFIRIDGASTGLPAWRFHLGSTGCEGDPMAGGVTSCMAGNRVEVALNDMDPATNTIRLDIAALLDSVDLDTQTENTPAGCMSGAGDPDCLGYFESLGLAHGAMGAGTQRVFSVE